MDGVYFLLGFWALKSRKVEKILHGEPSLVVFKGKVLEDIMAKMPNFGVDDLWSQLRLKGIVNIDDVEAAVISDSMPPTSRQQGIHPKPTGLPVEVIQEGSIIGANLADSGLNPESLLDELKKQGIAYIKQVFYASKATRWILVR